MLAAERIASGNTPSAPSKKGDLQAWLALPVASRMRNDTRESSPHKLDTAKRMPSVFESKVQTALGNVDTKRRLPKGVKFALPASTRDQNSLTMKSVLDEELHAFGMSEKSRKSVAPTTSPIATICAQLQKVTKRASKQNDLLSFVRKIWRSTATAERESSLLAGRSAPPTSNGFGISRKAAAFSALSLWSGKSSRSIIMSLSRVVARTIGGIFGFCTKSATFRNLGETLFSTRWSTGCSAGNFSFQGELH